MTPDSARSDQSARRRTLPDLDTDSPPATARENADTLWMITLTRCWHQWEMEAFKRKPDAYKETRGVLRVFS